MSRATVRAALRAFLAAGCDPFSGSVPGVLKVYKAAPRQIVGRNWDLEQNLGSGAVVFLHFADKGETRESMPAEGVTPTVVGVKSVTYQVVLAVLYQYLNKSGSQAVALAGDEWVDPLDATLDGLEALLRSDPTAGTGPLGTNTRVVFEMAQSPGDLTLPQDLPRSMPGKILSWQALHFSATEVIFA